MSSSQITAWSYSRLTDWESCHLRARLKYIDKLPEPPSPALKRGADTHDQLEAWGKGLSKTLPPMHPDILKLVKAVPRKAASVELEWAFDRAWLPVGWFDRETWLRVKLDLLYVTKDARTCVRDYKTGRPRPESVDQLELYALGALASKPALEVVDTALWYLDTGDVVAKSFTRDDEKALRRRWEKRVKPMLADRTFKATPGNACRWCPFSKAKGGPCKF